MSFSLYRPCSVALPVASEQKRMMVRCDPVGEPNPPWPAREEVWKFDECTVFYDIRYSPATQQFIALGPPAENLSAAFGQIKADISQGGEEVAQNVSFTAKPMNENVVIYRTTEKVELAPKPQISLRFTIGDVEIDPVKIVGHRANPGNIFATTLQKNSNPDWVCDWLDYLEWLGVDGALIYDNGSENHSVLREALRARKTNQTVQLIEWPFPYGPRRFPRLRYCQDGQIAHAANWYWPGKWMLTLDLDTYPILHATGEKPFEPKKNALRTLLENTPDEIGAYELPGRNVFATAGDDLSDKRSARDFSVMEAKQIKNANKHIVRLNALNWVSSAKVKLKPKSQLIRNKTRKKNGVPDEQSLREDPKPFYAHILPLSDEKNELFHSERIAPVEPETAKFATDSTVQHVMEQIDQDRET